jgi:zinc D-Ala-D-Ala carboxypeptidase
MSKKLISNLKHCIVGLSIAILLIYLANSLPNNLSFRQYSKSRTLPNQSSVLGISNKNNILLVAENSTINHCVDKYKSQIYEIANPEDLTAIINKNFKIPSNYVPSDLVLLTSEHYPVVQNTFLRRIIIEDLEKMLNAMSDENINVLIISGWRSHDGQLAAYNRWVTKVGTSNAQGYAALPGHSEHQLGTVLDFAGFDNNNVRSYMFENTTASNWLKENAYKYGFVMSYPKNSLNITGYNYEPWHYRYVGTEIANKLNANNTTLTEYLLEINNICIF